MIRTLSAIVLACAMGIGILGCQSDQSGNTPGDNAGTGSTSGSGSSNMSSGGAAMGPSGTSQKMQNYGQPTDTQLNNGRIQNGADSNTLSNQGRPTTQP